ncbi:MAG: CYTH domain-containing protein [Deltaproteobacteria bacterium]|nr:CYTH domain-containing protein [Deltaproteobacteria bacterium]
MKRSSSEESEATFIIRSESPEAVAQQIARLTSIGGYRLVVRKSQEIHDLYLDTPGRMLEARDLALRIREIGGAHWLALKGRSRPSQWGGVTRLEIEGLWCEKSLARITGELTDRGIRLPRSRLGYDPLHPLDSMRGLGFRVIQDRETRRQLRDVIPAGNERSGRIAELAIDSVAYHFGDRVVRHHEVELEAKRENALTPLETVMEELTRRYSGKLQRWDYGKLATGKAIGALLDRRELEGLLDARGHLKPPAYDRIAALLQDRFDSFHFSA